MISFLQFKKWLISKYHGAGSKFPYIKNCNYIYFAFFLMLFFNFSLLDPDPHIECESGSSRENKCGSMWILIHSPATRTIYLLPTC